MILNFCVKLDIGVTANLDDYCTLNYFSVKPTVTLGCSSPISVNEGDDVVCECRGQGGNPPADVTWFKDNIKIGRTGKEEQVLALSNVDGKNDGTYTCAAQSHVDSTDRKSVEVKVKLNCKYII